MIYDYPIFLFMASSSLFRFKEFSVSQDKCAMKVGTDGVLLGAWAEAREGKILDIGTGTGLIALMLAQRTNTSFITGIEIDSQAAVQAKENVQASRWKDRLQIICQDIKLFSSQEQYDEIISNPPFYQHSPSSSSESRNIARRTTPLFFENMVSFVQTHLSSNGVFEVILPAEAAEDFIFLCWQHDLFIKRHTQVYTKEGKASKRSLLSFTRTIQEKRASNLYIMDRSGQLTREYSGMVKDFYWDKDNF